MSTAGSPASIEGRSQRGVGLLVTRGRRPIEVALMVVSMTVSLPTRPSSGASPGRLWTRGGGELRSQTASSPSRNW